ncbi:MAG: hypothetical protein COA63_000850 [Methylophaga sp.]|nr:hypothetical protein [Methylophaga sp.]
MATVVNDLVTKFSFSGTAAPLTDYNVTLGSSIKLLGGMIAGLNAAAGAFAFWADGVLKGVDSLSALSHQTGVSVSAIQELSFAATQSQSTTAAMESSIKGLSRTIGQAAQQGSDDFSRLGISVRDANGQVKSADKIMLEVGKRFRELNLSMSEQEHFASALGIDSSLLQLLNKTGTELAGLRDRAKELGVLTRAQTEDANDYTKSVNSMWFSVNSFKQLIAVGVAPEMRRMSDEFTQLLIDNKEWVIGGVKFAIKWGGILLESFNRMLPVLGLMAGAFIAMKVATLGWAGAMAIAGAPIVVITAAIAALYLVVDDLVAAFSGGKSVIADFYNAMTGGDLVAELTTGFGFLKTAVDVLVDSLMEVWNLLGKIGDWMLSGGVSVAKFLGLVDEDSSATNMTAPMTLRNDGLPNADGSQMQDNRQVIQHNNITITTNDPQGTSRAVDSVLNRQLDNANTQLSVGGR